MVKMKYDPQIPMELGYSQEETLAYALTCWWLELRAKIFPDYRHQPVGGRKGDIRKSYLFKNILKFVREKKDKFKGFQYVLYMRAQLEVLKKIQNDGKPVVVEANCLHGEQSYKRWLVWKKIVAVKNNTSKITYKVVDSNLTHEFEKTQKVINNLLGDEKTLQKFVLKRDEILKYVILKKISPLYIKVSKWINQLDAELIDDLKDLSNVKKYDEYDMGKVYEIYEKYFSWEISKS